MSPYLWLGSAAVAGAAWSMCQDVGHDWCSKAGLGGVLPQTMQAESCHGGHHHPDVPTAPFIVQWSAGKGQSEASLVLAGSGSGQGPRARLSSGRLQCHVGSLCSSTGVFGALMAVLPSLFSIPQHFFPVGEKGKTGKELCLLSSFKPPEII